MSAASRGTCVGILFAMTDDPSIGLAHDAVMVRCLRPLVEGIVRSPHDAGIHCTRGDWVEGALHINPDGAGPEQGRQQCGSLCLHRDISLSFSLSL